MSSTFLSRDEVCELTGRRQHAAQARALRAMGIEHRVRPDGSIAVLRTHIEAELAPAATRRVADWQPNWSAA
ncbi:hypothetical protein LV28_18880 [Pandoraea pnomenusa]|uniref:DUF4224 domain-containing protein n=1 Tax=Pandoraea pnomenusa TaxID=93220 RepID=A0A378YUC6_9BURK|nr:DUF4224 domain-containing protein [Pandoraea pnomenusa]AIU28357.1 hypothetical protein LV28_18880 [Pandoraea pnomenusa]SUA80408.1 Uncharacterised protein [Pandoraea pnomenusa]